MFGLMMYDLSISCFVPNQVNCYIEACNSIMNPIMDMINPLNPPKVWDEIGYVSSGVV